LPPGLRGRKKFIKFTRRASRDGNIWLRFSRRLRVSWPVLFGRRADWSEKLAKPMMAKVIRERELIKKRSEALFNTY
jgi:hypothetical protein